MIRTGLTCVYPAPVTGWYPTETGLSLSYSCYVMHVKKHEDNYLNIWFFMCVFLICPGWTESSLSLCLAQLEIYEVSFGWFRILLHIEMKHALEICVILYCACFLSYALVSTCLVLGTDTLDHRPHSPIHTHSYCAPVRYTLVHSQLSGTTLRLIGKQSVAQFCP